MDKYIGKKLDGRYEIRELIGVGGMAMVYKAHDSIDDRIVAIKILKEEFASNEEFRRRFKNESKAIAILSHPNIVKVYDVSFGDTLQYIVMEYVDGITLKEYIEQQGTIRWQEAVHFTVQVLRALEHAHKKGIIHRDIKPQNIILLQDGTIKVADFGIAPKQNVIRLSSDVYHGDSVAAVGIAAHEAGHAAQYAAGYAPIRIRNSFIPLCNIGSSMSYLVILAGVIFQANILLLIGVGLFSLTTIFHLLTLPVEFNASRRAIETLERSSLLNEEELTGAEKVLKSAAMTYVAAAVSSIAVLLYYMFRFLGNGRKE